MQIDQLDGHLGCYFTGKQGWILLCVAISVLYVTWDWMIVGLYIYKLHQLTQDIKNIDLIANNVKTNEMLQKMTILLNKILFLTVIPEMVAILTVLPDIFSMFHVISTFGYAIDNIVVVLVLYLMLDHNEDDYFALLAFMARLGCLKRCCCCFGNLASKLDRALSVNISKQNEPVDNKDVVIKETNVQNEQMSMTQTHQEIIPKKTIFMSAVTDTNVKV